MRYRRKNAVVEAFQMTKERSYDNREWPAWLDKAWNAEEETPGSVYLSDTTGGKFIVGSPEGPLLVRWGFHIIKNPNGDLDVCHPDVFLDRYEESPPPNALIAQGRELARECPGLAQIVEQLCDALEEVDV